MFFQKHCYKLFRLHFIFPCSMFSSRFFSLWHLPLTLQVTSNALYNLRLLVVVVKNISVICFFPNIIRPTVQPEGCTFARPLQLLAIFWRVLDSFFVPQTLAIIRPALTSQLICLCDFLQNHENLKEKKSFAPFVLFIVVMALVLPDLNWYGTDTSVFSIIGLFLRKYLEMLCLY